MISREEMQITWKMIEECARGYDLSLRITEIRTTDPLNLYGGNPPMTWKVILVNKDNPRESVGGYWEVTAYPGTTSPGGSALLALTPFNREGVRTGSQFFISPIPARVFAVMYA